MRHAIARVHDDACCAARRIQGEDSLNGHIHGGNIESIKHDLRHPFAVCLWIQRCLCQQDWVFFWCDPQFVVEGVMPDFLHVVPIGDNAMLDWVLQSQHTSFALGLVSNITVFLVHANHNARHLWTAYNGWEDCTRRIITSKTSLAHTA